MVTEQLYSPQSIALYNLPKPYIITNLKPTQKAIRTFCPDGRVILFNILVQLLLSVLYFDAYRGFASSYPFRRPS